MYHNPIPWKAYKITSFNIGDATNNGADLTTCYKLLNSLIDIDSTNFLVDSTNIHTRGNSRKLTKNHIFNIPDANMFHNKLLEQIAR